MNPLDFRPNTPVGKRWCYTMHGAHLMDTFTPEAAALGNGVWHQHSMGMRHTNPQTSSLMEINFLVILCIWLSF